MSRSRSSAKQAGARFETLVAAYLSAHVDDRIERRARNGSKDRGDVSGVRAPYGGRVVVECKDTARTDLAGWAAEAEVERGNDDALVGVVVHKRRGTTDPARQWVQMTLADFVALLTNERPELSTEDLASIAVDSNFERTQDASDRGTDEGETT